MKCIQCGTDNTRKNRTTHHGQCKNCRHPFVFEPYEMNSNLRKLTDGFFQRAIQGVSANNTLFFTSNQLFYFLNRKLTDRSFLPRFRQFAPSLTLDLSISTLGWLFPLLAIAVTAGSLSKAWLGTIGYVISFAGCGAIFMVFILSEPARARQRQLQREEAIAQHNQAAQTAFDRFRQGKLGRSLVLQSGDFQQKLRRWQEVNGPISKLLQVNSAPLPSNPIDQDVTAYSFDRLVVCQSDTIAQLLIANQFHFENNCAVLSVNGYPASIFDTIMQMVRRNLELKVYTFHDCSLDGMELLSQLQTSDRWFRDSAVTIIDAGLRPQQVIQAAQSSPSDRDFRLFVQWSLAAAHLAKQRLEADPLALSHLSAAELSAAELEWLMQGYFVVLESFTPQKLIQVLNRRIAASQQPNFDDGEADRTADVVEGRNVAFYGVDSFG